MLPINTRTTVFMSRPDALKGTLTSTMKKALPTVVVAVPRVYEKMMEKLKETFNQASVCFLSPSLIRSASSVASSIGLVPRVWRAA